MSNAKSYISSNEFAEILDRIDHAPAGSLTEHVIVSENIEGLLHRLRSSQVFLPRSREEVSHAQGSRG